MAEVNFNNSPLLFNTLLLQNNQNQVACAVQPDIAAAIRVESLARLTGDDIVPSVEILFNLSIESPDWRQKEAAILALGSIMEGPTCEKLAPSIGFALRKIVNVYNLSQNKYLTRSIVWFLRRFFECQLCAIVETFLSFEQSTCEKIFDILLQSMDDGPDVAENACYAVCFLARCPYLWNVLPKFSEKCVFSLHITAHKDVGQLGLRMAAYEAFHEVVSFLAAPVILKLIPHFACDLKKNLHEMDPKYRLEYIQYKCRGLKIISHKLGQSEATDSLFNQHLDSIVQFLLHVFDDTQDVGCRKDAMIAIGNLAHAGGPGFENHIPTFFEVWELGLKDLGGGKDYDAMVGVMIRISRALKGDILAYCDGILCQLDQNLFSCDLDEISTCSILYCYAELALAIGADFHKYLGRTMDALGKLTSPKDEVLLKPRSRHLICAMLELYFAIIRCFEDASVSHCLSPFASGILDFLRLICGLDMDARPTTAAILFIRCLADVPGEIFSSFIYKDKSIQSFLEQCLFSKDPLIKACADRANWRVFEATRDLRWRLSESKVSEKHLSAIILNPVQDQEHEYSEQHLLSIFYNLQQGVDSYGKNSIIYISLATILSKHEEHVARRILAGKVLLTALGSKKKWNCLNYPSICWISKCLVQTLSSCEVEACSMAIRIMKHIAGFRGGFDLLWGLLGEFLCSDVDHHQLEVKYLTFEMLADLLKNGLHPCSSRPNGKLINRLHNAILKITRASNHCDSVIRSWLQILHCTYYFGVEVSDYIINFIFDATESSEGKIKVAALECLTTTCSNFHFDLQECPRVRSVIFKAMEDTDKRVAYQGIVFWIPVCQNEMSEPEDHTFVMETSESLVAVLLEILFTRCTQLLEPTNPDQHKETRNLAKAALKCLHFVAETIGNKIIQLVEETLLLGIGSSNAWKREAGIRAFGSILVGPTSEELSSLMTSAFSKILHALEGSTDSSLSSAVTWTLSQIFEFHHPIVKTLKDTEYEHVINFLQLRISDVPIVAKNVCHALSSLLQGVDAYMWKYLSPYFGKFVHSLYAVGYSDSVKCSGLKVAANEALHEFMKCANDEHFEVMLSLTSVIMNDLSHALEAKEYTIEGLKNQCRSILVITQKLGTSEKYRPEFLQHVHRIITLLTRVLECGSVINRKEAMLAVGAIAYVNGGAFEEHMETLEKCWEVGIQNRTQHFEVYLVMLSVIADVCRVLKQKMLQFCDKIMMLFGASNGQLSRYWGPSISFICEMAEAIGDRKFLEYAINILKDKNWFSIDRGHHFCPISIWFLRPGLVEAYRAIFQGLKNCSVYTPLHRFEDDTLGVLLEFSNLLYQENNMDRGMTRRVIEVLEHLSSRMNSDMKSLINPSSPLEYSDFSQGLVDHLLKPSLIKNMNLVEGCKLVEVYAVHVETKQPCDLYGTIKVNAAIVSHCLYNQERGDAEPVRSGKEALFFSVVDIIPGGEGLTLEVDLKHKVGDGGASTDDEVCRNETTMICGGDAHPGYNQPLEATVEGKNGSVRISFIEFDRATTAYVKVGVVLPPEGIDGKVTACNMRYPSIRRELRRRNRADGIILNDTTVFGVNLCEGVVAVPLNSVLVVKADLWLSGGGGRQASFPFKKFSAEFNVTPGRSTSKVCVVDNAECSTIIIEVHFGVCV